MWGSRSPDASPIVVHNSTDRITERRMQTLQLWSDWYTLLRAKRVYHTHSDFSLSAIHWMGNMVNTTNMMIWSRTILDMNTTTNQLEFGEESWIIEEEVPPVVDRRGDQLKNCKNNDDGKIDSHSVVSVEYDDDDSHHPEPKQQEGQGEKKIIQAMSDSETKAFFQRALNRNNNNNSNKEKNFEDKDGQLNREKEMLRAFKAAPTFFAQHAEEVQQILSKTGDGNRE